jgi:hypothetical protein
MGHGGKRKGAGRRPGKTPAVKARLIGKEQAIEYTRSWVTARLSPLLESAYDHAVGIRHLMMRDPKTGQFERVTGTAEQIDEALKSPNAFWIYTKDPSVQAFTDLLNRAMGKPAAQVEVTGSDDGPVIFKWQE